MNCTCDSSAGQTSLLSLQRRLKKRLPEAYLIIRPKAAALAAPAVADSAGGCLVAGSSQMKQ